MARAVQLVQVGDLDGLQQVEVSAVKPGEGQVVVRVRAAGLNFRDALIVQGHYPAGFAGHGVPVTDGAGEVVETGPGVTRVRVGDRVVAAPLVSWISGPPKAAHRAFDLGVTMDGMLRDHAVIDADALVLLPDSMSFEEAATLPCAATTAWNALTQPYPLLPGQTVVTLGSGSVSLFALQFAKMAGARVIATTSSPTKAERLRALGADEVIDYIATPDWATEIRRLTDGIGADRIVEVGGPSTLPQSIAATAVGGRIGMIGFLGGQEGAINPVDLLIGGVSLDVPGMGSRTMLEELVAAMAKHATRPVIDRVFPFAQFRDAYRHISAPDRFGKTVITID